MSERNLTQVGGSFVGTMEDFTYSDDLSKQLSREIYIFDQDDVLLTVLSESTGLISTKFRDELNNVPDEPFVFTVDAETEKAKHVKEENQVAFRDKEGDLRLYTIKEVDDLDNIDGPQTTATCEPAFMELKEHIVVDRRFVEREAQEALDAALEDTRWTGIVEVSLGLATTNFYYISSVDAIWHILEVWGGDFKDVIEFDGNKITKREIHIKQRLGADRGLRFEIDHNIEEIERTVLSYPVTALYGRGASLEITDEEGEHTGGYTRYIDFADVEWKKSNGDPVDKPKGQRWVGDPDALQRYGRQNDGQLLHRFGIWQDHDLEDPAELLRATWEVLQEVQKPEVNYRLSVDLLDKEVSLGDTARAIDRNFARPIEIQTRIIAMEYDLLDIEGTTVVELGQFLNLEDDRLDRVIGDIERNRGRWEYVTEDSYPNRIPSKPTNVEAHGGFRVIQLYWDYTDEVFVKHYEVYGSQTQGFVPDEQHLLWRGDVSAFTHEVDTDERWYYRVRAVNYHGRGGDFSNEVSASTVRIITDDILFGSITKDLLADLAVDASKLADEAVETSKLADGSVEAEKIANLAVGNAAIQNGAITRAKIDTAAIGTAQIEDLAVTSAKIASVNADKINASSLSAISANLGTVTAGVLQSNNSNVTFNLNTSRLEIASGGTFIFTDPNNGIRYSTGSRSSGIVLSHSLGYNSPMVAIGVDHTTGVIDANSANFSGLRIHARGTDLDNNMISRRFIFTERADMTGGGFVIQSYYDGENARSFHPWNADNPAFVYDLGRPYARWRRVYLNYIYGADEIRFLNIYDNSDAGWVMKLAYAGDPTIDFYPQYTGSYYYNIGRSNNRINKFYVDIIDGNYLGTSSRPFDVVYARSVVEGSDRKLKSNITLNRLGLDFINDLETVEYTLNGDGRKNGLIAQDVQTVLEKHGVNFANQSIVVDGEYMGISYTQLIAPLIKSVQELDKKTSDNIEWLKIENQYLKQKVKQLEELIA